MIHTIQIQYIITSNEFSQLLKDVYKHIAKSSNKEDIIKTIKEFQAFPKAPALHIPSRTIGICSMVFYHDKESPNIIYLSITIDIQSLITNSRTPEVFLPNYDGVKALCLSYASVMIKIFPSTIERIPFSITDGSSFTNLEDDYSRYRLPYLSLSKLKRIDYSYNLLASEHKAETIKLMQKSYHDSRKEKSTYQNNNNFTAKSKAQKPTSETTVYDKALYYRDKGYPQNLVDAAKDIIRFEYKRNSFANHWLVKNYPIPSEFRASPFIRQRSPIAFFDEDTCARILSNEYRTHIGTGTWMQDYYFKKALNASSLTTKAQNTIKNKIAPIISQARSITKAREAFISKTYRLAKTGEIISGSKATFDKYLHLLEDINLNPFRIPDTYTGITEIANPINNILIPTTVKNYNYQLPSAISSATNSLLDYLWNSLERRK